MKKTILVLLSAMLAICISTGICSALTVQGTDGIDITDECIVTVSDVVYTGKIAKPTVKIVHEDSGYTLEKGVDYTYAVSEDSVKVGKGTVVVTGTGDYEGTVEANFSIRPPKMAKPTCKASKKAFTVKWKKQSKTVIDKSVFLCYQIDYSTSSKFTKKQTKTIAVSTLTQTSKTIKKLSAKKKYYVRIRTLASGYGACAGPWSSVATVKTK